MIIFADSERWYVDVDERMAIIDDARQLTRLRAELHRALTSSPNGVQDELGAGTRAALHQASLVTPVIGVTDHEPRRSETTESVRRAARPLASISIEEALARRGSTRTLLPPTAEDIITVLFHSARVRAAWYAADGFLATSRPSPSAGARHPFELSVVIGRSVDVEPGVYSFDPLRCELRCASRDPLAIRKLLDRSASLMGQEDAPPAVIYLFADLRRTLSRYPLGISLVFRDAGALLATMALTASAAGLGTCILASACTGTLNEVLQRPSPYFADLGSVALGRFNIIEPIDDS